MRDEKELTKEQIHTINKDIDSFTSYMKILWKQHPSMSFREFSNIILDGLREDITNSELSICLDDLISRISYGIDSFNIMDKVMIKSSMFPKIVEYTEKLSTVLGINKENNTIIIQMTKLSDGKSFPVEAKPEQLIPLNDNLCNFIRGEGEM